MWIAKHWAYQWKGRNLKAETDCRGWIEKIRRIETIFKWFNEAKGRNHQKIVRKKWANIRIWDQNRRA